MGRQVVIAWVLLMAACAAGPDCSEAEYTAHGICVIEPQVTQECFVSIVEQFHTWFPDQDYDWYSDNEYAVSWRPERLKQDEHAATFRECGRLWTEIDPDGRLPSKSFVVIKQPLVHEFLHVMDYRQHGKMDESHDLTKQHDSPKGWFEYVYGENSLETQIRMGIDWSCL